MHSLCTSFASCLITQPHSRSINPIQYLHWCLNWFVARNKLVLAFALARELVGCFAVVASLAVDDHGRVCRSRRTISAVPQAVIVAIPSYGAPEGPRSQASAETICISSEGGA